MRLTLGISHLIKSDLDIIMQVAKTIKRLIKA